jgi:hypothetical protein
MEVKVLGVHPVDDAPEPCALIEVAIDNADDFDWGAVTQEVDGQPRDNWQAPWDEQPLDKEERRWAFFFHYLDDGKPLLTADGPVKLPKSTPRPKHLKAIKYEEP